MAVEGIDVSHFQGTIEWARVRAAGKSFAFAKATDGLGEVDPMFHANRSGARSAGLVFGAYHFARLNEDATAQATHLCETLGSTEGELPPALDVESASLAASLQAAEVVAWIHEFVQVVRQKTNRPPIVYCPPSFWESSAANTHDFSSLPLWIARYTTESSPDPLPGGWGSWTFWQYSSGGTVPGIAGACDLDRFAGDAAALTKLTHS